MESESGNNSGGANRSDVNNIIQYFQDINIVQPISESKLKIILKEVQGKQQQHPELVTTSKLHEYVRDLLLKCSAPSSESDANTLLLTEPETSNALQFLKVISEDTKISPLLCPPEILVLFAKSIFPQVTTLICNSETTSTSLASSQKCSSLLHKTVRVSLNLVKAITSRLSKQLSENPDDDGASNSEFGVNPWLSLQEFGIEFLNLLSSHPTAALDIKSNAGLVVSHLARRKFLDQLLSSTANGHGTCSVSSSEFVSINNGNLFEKAVHKFVSLDHVNKVAMCFGALGTRQDLTTEFMVSIANCVLLEEQSNSTKEAVNLGAARVLEIWMDKLNTMFPSSQLQELSSVLSLMEIFIFTYLAGHIDAVKNCCRNMLSNLSVAYTSLDDGDEDSPLLTDLLVKILAKPYHVKWVSLASVTRTNPQSVLLLRLWKDPAENLLCAQRTFKNAAADVYLSLMKYTFKTYDSTLWVKTWITPLLETQIDQDNESNWTQKKIILSKAMSFKEREIQQCILSTVVATMRSTSESFSSLSIESCLLIVECLKIGTELGVPIDQNEIGSAPPPPTLLDSGSGFGDDKKITNTLFRGVLPRDIFNSWAFHANPQIRLATFSILVDTKKTSEVFNEADFEAIKVLFRYSLVNQSPAFRQQFMSYFKKLMRRLKDGRSSCKRLRRTEDFENYNDFIKWMWTFFTREGLFAGANFSRRYQSLDCIVELLEHFPVESLTENITENESLSFIRWLGDTYENNKISAVEILSRIKIPAFEDAAFCEHILQTATNLLTSVKPPDSVTSRYLLLLLLKASRSYYPWNFLRMLLTKLERIVESLKRKKCTLLEVSSTTPPYGIIRAIRLIFVTYKSEIIYETCNLKKNPSKSLKSGSHPLTFDLLQDYSRRLLTACFDLDDILFPVLGDAAPEGFLPDLNENDKILPESSKIVRSINAQMLLVSSWRSMKEICILLTELCVHFPLEGELDDGESSKNDGGSRKPGNNKRFMLQFPEVRDIGNHLVYLLMNLMHRGVFEQVFVGFKSLAVRLKKSTSLKLNKLSEEWLEDIMGNVKDKCTTRRSAGLPFIFQAILTPETGNEFKITYWMKKLLELDPEQKSIAVVRIHSMNVLRALFRDANFSRAIMSWVPDGIQLAFIGLRAKEWAEQNSGLMLYGSVIRRTFGPNLNLMSAPTFFRKFPQMYDFLLREIKGTAGDITKSWNSAASHEGDYKMTQKEDDFAYHVLLLFSCFSSAPGKLEEGNYRLSAFIPYIQACGASRDVQVRTMAAKALVPFITSPVDRQKVLENSLENLIFHSKVIRSNRIHGDLLQLVAIVHLIQSYEEEIETSLIEKFQIIIDIVKNVKSPSIFEAFANLSIALARFNQKNLMSTAFTMQKINQESFEALYSSSKYTRRNCVPGLPDADEAVSKSAVTFECNSEISVSEWIEDGNPCVVEQLLVTLLEAAAAAQSETDYNKKEKDGKNKSSSIPTYCNKDFRISKENNVKLLKRYINENFNFQGQTDYECRYLTYFASNQFDIVEQVLNSSMSEEMIKLAIEKLILVCESDFGTVDCKAAALRVLAKFVFNSQTCVSNVVQFKDALCDLILEWTDSKSADELRLAAAESLPKLPLKDDFTCSDLQFCKLWSAAFILAQDDEIFIRSEAFKKLNEAGDIPGCSLKCLELLVEAFFQEITKRNTIVGFWALLALILKDDFDVIASGADDEDEDRLFERSEMNMFAETVTLTKLIVDHLTRNQNITEFLKAALDVPANIDHLNIFNQISHLHFDFKISGSSESVVPTNTVVLKCVLNSNVEDNSNMDWEVNIDKSNIEDILRGHEKEVVQQFIRRKMHNLFF